MTVLLDLVELADHADVPAARLRHVDDAGLLPAARRDGDRYGYHPDKATVVRLLDKADRLGLPTADLTELAGGWRSGDCPAVKGTLARAVTRRTTIVQGEIAGRLRAAAAAFTRLGYPDVRVDEGGKADWTRAGLPPHSNRTATSEAA